MGWRYQYIACKSTFRSVNAQKPAGKIKMSCKTGHRWAMWTYDVVTRELQKIDTTPTEKKKSAIQQTKRTHKNKAQALISSQYTCLSNSKQVTHTSSTWDRMRPHTINNNWLHSLKDFPRQKCFPYQYCPSLPPSPAVLWYHIWPLCAQGDFQLLKRWAGWEWATDLWAAFLYRVGTERSVWDWLTRDKHILFLQHTPTMT